LRTILPPQGSRHPDTVDVSDILPRPACVRGRQTPRPAIVTDVLTPEPPSHYRDRAERLADLIVHLTGLAASSAPTSAGARWSGRRGFRRGRRLSIELLTRNGHSGTTEAACHGGGLSREGAGVLLCSSL